MVQGSLTKIKSTQNVQFWLRFDEKLGEKAEHTQVCEHFEPNFSSNLSQKWTLPGFHEVALLGGVIFIHRVKSSSRGIFYANINSMAKIVFYKLHGLGNDFMVVDGVNQAMPLSAEQVTNLGNRHMGVGFDQLLVIAPPETQEADFNFIIFNQDGSLAEQCGNGARCVARFIQQEGLSAKKELRLFTAGKITTVTLEDQGWVTVQMPAPLISPANSLKIAKYLITFHLVDMGNPHAVTFVDEIKDSFVKEIGAG